MRLLPALALATTLAMTGCGGSDPAASPQQTQTPSPTPTLPPVADDKANVKAAIVTAAELGKPWVKPKQVSRTKNAKGERCPGQKNAGTLAKARAEEAYSFTKGTAAGVPIASFGVRAYEFGEEATWRDAVAKSAAGCAAWNAAEGTYVTGEVVTPPTIPGADEVYASIERVYADKTMKTLHYVRHYYEARSGRIVTWVEYAYVQPKTDPTGKDLSVSAPLLTQQIAKTRTTFGL